MESWILRSPMIFVNSSRGSFPQGSYYTPVVVWDAPRNRFLAWVSYFLADDSSGCLGAHCPPPKMGCPAGWYVAESTDGIRFTFVRLVCDHTGTNMNALLQDDDGRGFIAYRR